MLVSTSDMALVSAAKSTSKKNPIPAIRPAPMLSKTFGNVINISEGPALSFAGSPPENANTAGITISPAKTATPVSTSSTLEVDISTSTSLVRYEP